MGLESATFISGLTSSWPLAGDNKSVGDDHLRLIKAVLKSTFPTASKPFYFPTAETITGTLVLDGTDENNNVLVNTTAGNISVVLPTGFTTTEKGWKCQVTKITTDTNAAIITPSSGTISSKAGSTASIRVGLYCEPATFTWTGSAWICSKPGPMIGTTESYNGAGGVPRGYLAEDGSSFNSTDFAELFAVLATSTLRDKRGRVDIGSGTGSGLTARTLGATYGVESVALSLTELPTGITSTNTGSIALTGTTNQKVIFGPNTGSAVGGGTQITASDPGSGGEHALLGITGTIAVGAAAVTSNNTGGAAHTNLQPSIGALKIIRAC